MSYCQIRHSQKGSSEQHEFTTGLERGEVGIFVSFYD